MAEATVTRRLLTMTDVHALTGISIDTLRYWRYRGEGGPKSFKLGRRVMYAADDVQEWVGHAADAR